MIGPYLQAQPPTVAIWESLYNLYAILGSIAAILVISYLVYNVLRNRAKGNSASATHDEEEGVNWRKVLFTLAITSSVLFLVEYQTFASSNLVVTPQASDALHINVIAQQWSWTFVYPNGVKVANNLTVPAGKTVILNITSVDVAHSFTITNLDVGKDAIPGRFNSLWFTTPTSYSVFTIRCKELCGIGHAFMTAHMTVVDPASYAQWYASLGAS
jgi:cytochrome c oxidase subunit 2